MADYQDQWPNDGSVYISEKGHYDVYISDEGYSVRNTTTGVVEYSSKSLPQAIGVAEQYDYMLSNNTWQEVLADMFVGYTVPTRSHLSSVPLGEDA